jgi:RNA polymerase sigma-70 factor (ECF subfamily)
MLTTSPTLLERLRRPEDSPAWERFVRLYTPLLLNWARRQGLQDADAADLVQDVLVKLYRLLPSYERGPGQSFRGWLSRVLVNQARDYRRARATRGLSPADGLDGVGVADPTPELEEVEYRQALVHRGLELVRGHFSDTTWRAFTGVLVAGRPAADVAAELGVTENAVYLARHRVLTRLREELEGLLD